MKHPDFDKAFAPTPDIIALSIEDAFKKGEKAMKLRHKITAMLSAAAVLAIAFGVIGLALPNEPQPDVLAQPLLTEEPTVYYNIKGTYYHSEEHCSGMLGAELHTVSEAKADGKKACPVCVTGENAQVSGSIPDLYGNAMIMDESGQVLLMESEPMPAAESRAESLFSDRTPADVGSEIFENVFGVDIFDAFAGYEYISTGASGSVDGNGDGVHTDVIEFQFSENDALFRPVIITTESQNGAILSGNIFLNFTNAAGQKFREQASAWYQNVCNSAAETIDGMGALGTGSGGMAELPLQVYAYLDGELKPSVCVLDYESSSGFITLSFDVNGDEISLASMHYDVSKA